MIRRTLALVGAVLVVGASGLAGPAAADPGASILTAQAVIGEVGTNLNTTVGFDEFRGDIVELHEVSGTDPFPLNGFALIGCSDVADFTIATFDSNHTIPAGGIFLVADQTYQDADGPDRNAPFAAGADLVQAAGGVRLVDASSMPVHDGKWSDPPTACDSHVATGALPSNSQTLNYNATTDLWSLNGPTPGS